MFQRLTDWSMDGSLVALQYCAISCCQHSKSVTRTPASPPFHMCSPLRSPRAARQSSPCCTVGSHLSPILHTVTAPPRWPGLSSTSETTSALQTIHLHYFSGLPRLSSKEPTCQCKRHGFDPCIGKIPWSRKLQLTPVYLPGKVLRQFMGVAKSWTWPACTHTIFYRFCK